MPITHTWLRMESLHLPARHAHVWIQRTALSREAEMRERYLSVLSDNEQERMQRFAFDELKDEFLTTRALCRLTLSRYTQIPPQAWRFTTNAWGRPEIDPAFFAEPLRFNLSNTRSLVACIVTRDADAGIDVETLARRNPCEALADRFFSAEESRQLREAAPAERQRRFYEFWTLKEAYIKARGMGLAIPLDQFSFELEPPAIRVAFDTRLSDDPGHWQFGLRAVDASHLLAIAIRKGTREDFSVTIREATEAI